MVDMMQVVDFLAGFTELCSLYTRGNPFLSEIKQFRKGMIASLPKLSYVDDRPVFTLERSCAEAW